MDKDVNASEEVEEIPAVTYRKVLNALELKARAITTSKKIPKFFIRDILLGENTENDHGTKLFKVRDIECKFLMIRGVITGRVPYPSKTMISVDDNTGVINCFIEPNAYLEQCKEEVDEDYQEILTAYENVPNNKLLQAALMMHTCTKRRLQKFPGYLELKVGDTVQVIGKVSEYKDFKYFFATHIMRETNVCASTIIWYLRSVRDLYEKEYGQFKRARDNCKLQASNMQC